MICGLVCETFGETELKSVLSVTFKNIFKKLIQNAIDLFYIFWIKLLQVTYDVKLSRRVTLIKSSQDIIHGKYSDTWWLGQRCFPKRPIF